MITADPMRVLVVLGLIVIVNAIFVAIELYRHEREMKRHRGWHL